MYHHSYDNSMKAILQEDATEIVPYLLPGAIFKEALREWKSSQEGNKKQKRQKIAN